MKRKVKIILNIVLILIIFLILNLNVFAEVKYFSVEIPKGYLVIEEPTDNTRIVAVRTDKKVNFNIQMFSTDIEKYYEYSEEGLEDLIRIASEDMTDYVIGKVDGKISKVNKYPCYELIYDIIAKNTKKPMVIRQIYLYEDTYSYTITIGGENEELITSNEIEKVVDSFTLVKYERNKVKILAEEKEKEIKKQEALNEDSLKGKILRLIESFKKLNNEIKILILVIVVIILCSIIGIIVKNNKRKKRAKERIEKREIEKRKRK